MIAVCLRGIMFGCEFSSAATVTAHRISVCYFGLRTVEAFCYQLACRLKLS